MEEKKTYWEQRLGSALDATLLFELDGATAADDPSIFVYLNQGPVEEVRREPRPFLVTCYLLLVTNYCGTWDKLPSRGVRTMLSAEDNDLLTRVGAGTRMGELMRRYWVPALLDWELPEPDCPPVEVRLLGQDLVAFRQTDGRVGMVDSRCPHRGVSLFWGRNEENGLRCVYHGWKFDTDGQCVDMPSEP